MNVFVVRPGATPLLERFAATRLSATIHSAQFIKVYDAPAFLHCDDALDLLAALIAQEGMSPPSLTVEPCEGTPPAERAALGADIEQRVTLGCEALRQRMLRSRR